MRKLVFLLILVMLATPVLAGKKKYRYGPYRAEVVRVLDGDTVELSVMVWPGLKQTIKVRLDGVNTPEKRGKNISACEKKAGKAATAFTEQWLKGAKEVTLTGVHLGKYAGRALGRIVKDGKDLNEALVKAGHARYYDGGKRKGWCD